MTTLLPYTKLGSFPPILLVSVLWDDTSFTKQPLQRLNKLLKMMVHYMKNINQSEMFYKITNPRVKSQNYINEQLLWELVHERQLFENLTIEQQVFFSQAFKQCLKIAQGLNILRYSISELVTQYLQMFNMTLNDGHTIQTLQIKEKIYIQVYPFSLLILPSGRIGEIAPFVHLPLLENNLTETAAKFLWNPNLHDYLSLDEDTFASFRNMPNTCELLSTLCIVYMGGAHQKKYLPKVELKCAAMGRTFGVASEAAIVEGKKLINSVPFEILTCDGNDGGGGNIGRQNVNTTLYGTMIGHKFTTTTTKNENTIKRRVNDEYKHHVTTLEQLISLSAKKNIMLFDLYQKFIIIMKVHKSIINLPSNVVYDLLYDYIFDDNADPDDIDNVTNLDKWVKHVKELGPYNWNLQLATYNTLTSTQNIQKAILFFMCLFRPPPK